MPNRTIAARLSLHETTVCKWRRRFLEARMEGLFDAPRSGAPRRIGDDRIEEIVKRTLETTARRSTHWSTREMAKDVGVSQWTVSRIWRAFNQQPHRVEKRSPAFPLDQDRRPNPRERASLLRAHSRRSRARDAQQNF